MKGYVMPIKRLGTAVLTCMVARAVCRMLVSCLSPWVIDNCNWKWRKRDPYAWPDLFAADCCSASSHLQIVAEAVAILLPGVLVFLIWKPSRNKINQKKMSH